MRIKLALGAWLMAITLAWIAVAPSDLGVWPLVDEQGAASGWWRLRQQAIYLSGLWSIGLMSLVMVLALRLPALERPLGGMDQVYRLHKWAGTGAGVTAVMHWGLKEAGSWIGSLWGRAGRPARDTVLPWFTDMRGLAHDVGEWAFYLVVVMVLVTLWQRLVPYRRWRIVHRAMPLLYLVLVFHAAALSPLAFWTLPLGVLLGAMLALGSVAALWSLAGWVGLRRSHAAHIHALQSLGDPRDGAPLEVVCAMPPSWPGHRAGQFAFVRFDDAEGAHPFTIASAPGALGYGPRGEPLLRLVIKPLGDYTRTLHQHLQTGQRVHVEGPYGRFDAAGRAGHRQIWVAGGVGITPFLALLEARQPVAMAGEGPGTAVGGEPVRTTGEQSGGDAAGEQPTQLHYCTRNADRDPLLPRLRTLCAQAQPPVTLTVHSEAHGQRLGPRDLEAVPGPADIWFCGPAPLGDALHEHARGSRAWRLHRESFAMR